ncbi:MAG: sigma-70 family RNA polymerase sigma factor, partial [Myxococcota bacterium]|nr:sigma-70 family RNA polymerase sigma factor [Myxococcota bacterium]
CVSQRRIRARCYCNGPAPECPETQLDFVSDPASQQPDGGLDGERMRSGVGQLIGALTAREQLILRLRYGLGGEEEHTLEQIGQSLGLSRERVRQLEARALKKLRETAPAQNLHPILEP